MKGQSTLEMAHSDHIARKVDLGARVICNDADDKIAIIVNAGRNIRKYLSWTVNGRLCHGFGEFVSPDADWVAGDDEVKEASEKSKKDNNVIPPKGDKTTKLSFKPQFGRR
jgi:hypothetical protein